MVQILSNTPVWVWVLLASLIALGLAQVPERRVGRAIIPVLPVVVIASTALGLLAAFGPHWPVAGLASSAVLAGFGLNTLVLRSPRGVTWDGAARRFTVPGSWLPLSLILVIFGCRFAIGVARATAPAVAALPAFMAIIAAVMGLACGIFVSRAWVILAARN